MNENTSEMVEGGKEPGFMNGTVLACMSHFHYAICRPLPMTFKQIPTS